MDQNFTDINAATIDSWVDGGWEYGQPISHEEFLRAKQGDWNIFLSPTKPVPREWFPPLKGCRVLGLASGGGQQMPVLTAAGAHCTVMDYSPKQLEGEHMVAGREGYAIETVRGDMTQPFPFADNTFDVIFNPVSLCYVEDISHVWRECFRVLKPGGTLMTGLDTGLNYLFDDAEQVLAHKLPYNPLKDKALYEECIASGSGIQFSHTIGELLSSMLNAGFVIADIYDDTNGPTNGAGVLHTFGVPCMAAVLATKS